MQRRTFLAALSALPAVAVLPRRARGQQLAFDPRGGDAWRTFELITEVRIAKPAGATRAWVPVPAVEASWQRPGETTWTGNAAAARLVRDAAGVAMVAAEWPADEPAPALTVTSRVATRERGSGLDGPPGAVALDAGERARWTRATALMPIDGVVATTAAEVTRGHARDVDRARALYDWVVEHTVRDPATRGCGTGDVRALLAREKLAGKCADLNALYVALARSAGIPARDVYGIRVAPSRFGYRSLGAGSATVTKAQHCRAEVFLEGRGWVAADPADVRKVVLEEKPEPATLDDPVVQAVRAKLFGAWEMNWVAYNMAHDVALPGAAGPPLGFLMYPQAETAAGRLDCLDPDGFRYAITVRDVGAA